MLMLFFSLTPTLSRREREKGERAGTVACPYGLAIKS